MSRPIRRSLLGVSMAVALALPALAEGLSRSLLIFSERRLRD